MQGECFVITGSDQKLVYLLSIETMNEVKRWLMCMCYISQTNDTEININNLF